MHVKNFFRYLSYYFIAPFILKASYGIADISQKLLANALPEIFKSYSQLTEKEAYLAQRELIWVVAVLLTLLIIGILSVGFDNIKNEYIISKTEGLYTIKDGAIVYFEKFLLSDLICTTSVPIIFAIPAFIPRALPEKLEKLEKFISDYLKITTSLTDRYGIIVGFIILLSACLITRIIGVHFGLKRWRGLWLADIER